MCKNCMEQVKTNYRMDLNGKTFMSCGCGRFDITNIIRSGDANLLGNFMDEKNWVKIIKEL